MSEKWLSFIVIRTKTPAGKMDRDGCSYSLKVIFLRKFKDMAARRGPWYKIIVRGWKGKEKGGKEQRI